MRRFFVLYIVFLSWLPSQVFSSQFPFFQSNPIDTLKQKFQDLQAKYDDIIAEKDALVTKITTVYDRVTALENKIPQIMAIIQNDTNATLPVENITEITPIEPILPITVPPKPKMTLTESQIIPGQYSVFSSNYGYISGSQLNITLNYDGYAICQFNTVFESGTTEGIWLDFFMDQDPEVTQYRDGGIFLNEGIVKSAVSNWVPISYSEMFPVGSGGHVVKMGIIGQTEGTYGVHSGKIQCIVLENSV